MDRKQKGTNLCICTSREVQYLEVSKLNVFYQWENSVQISLLPARRASSAEMGSPVRTISIARDLPTALVSL